MIAADNLAEQLITDQQGLTARRASVAFRCLIGTDLQMFIDVRTSYLSAFFCCGCNPSEVIILDWGGESLRTRLGQAQVLSK